METEFVGEKYLEFLVRANRIHLLARTYSSNGKRWSLGFSNMRTAGLRDFLYLMNIYFYKKTASQAAPYAVGCRFSLIPDKQKTTAPFDFCRLPGSRTDWLTTTFLLIQWRHLPAIRWATFSPRRDNRTF